MSRELSLFVAISLFLNIYMVWQLREFYVNNHDKPEILGERESGPIRPKGKSLIRTESTQSATQDVTDVMAIIQNLLTRIERLENISNTADVKSSAIDDKPRRTEKLVSRLTEKLDLDGGLDEGEEDWFWNASGKTESSVSLGAKDEFSVHSVACRAGWCRVEVEEYNYDEEDENSTYELQLKINESLGRDSTIRWGRKTGNRRVIFIQ
jgi:hypothetical protein